ncbi:MAG: FtsX-like permease family protein, partial [Gemmatimonadaceae bacterium]
FAWVVACVLLIACANLANLILVRTLQQQRELAIRSALGGGVAPITRHLFLQNLLVVAAAALIGVTLASSSLGLLQSASALDSLRPPGMEYRLDGRTIAFVVLLATTAALMLSILPARLVARIDAQRLLREGGAGAGSGRWGRRVQQLFVVAQVASAVVLLTGGALMARSVLHLSQLDLGFDAQRVVQASPSYPHPWRVPEKYLPVTERILGLMATLPGVDAATLRAAIPLGARGDAPSLTLEGMAAPLLPGDAPPVAFAVTPTYFDVMGTRIVRGRSFADTDREAGIPVAIINEWAAKRWFRGQDPIGRTIRVDTAPSLGMSLSIVGVVRDNKAAQPNVLLSDDGAELYRPWLQSNSPFPTFLARASGAPASLLRPTRALLVREVPDRPLSATLLAEQVSDQLSGVRTNATQVLAFAAVGLFLALLGVYGVLAYAVGIRTRELGIRGALGATTGALRRLVLRDALWLAGLGAAIGLIAATSTMPLLRDLLHGTAPRDPLTFAAVAATVIAVSLFASWIPARRASRVNPVEALRGD